MTTHDARPIRRHRAGRWPQRADRGGLSREGRALRPRRRAPRPARRRRRHRRARARRPRPGRRPHGRAAPAVHRPRARTCAATACGSSPRRSAPSRRSPTGGMSPSGATSPRRGPRSRPGRPPTRTRSSTSIARCAGSRGSSPTSATRRRRTWAPPGFGDALMGLRLGRAFKGLGREDGRTILRVLAMAVADFVAESLEADPVRATARLARASATRRWGRGRRARPRSCSTTRPAATAARRARRSSRRAARAPSSTRWPRPSARPAARSARAPRSSRSPPIRRAGHRHRAGVGRGDRGARGRRQRRPEAAADDARRPGRRRAVAALARDEHPDAGPGRQGEPRARRAAGLPGGRRRARGCSAAGSSSG